MRNREARAITTLLLGIPGNLDWAILLGIMIMYGITPGPELIKDHPNVVLGIIGGTVAGNLLSSLIGLFVGTQLARLTGIKPLYIIPFILVSCMVDAFYDPQHDLGIVSLQLCYALCGYFLEKLGYELLPFTLGFVMAPPVEVNFYQTLQIGLGSYGYFFDSVTSISLIVISIVSIILGPRLRVPESRKGGIIMKNRTSVILKLLPDLIFPMLMAALGVYMFIASFKYQFETRAFAHATGGVLIILSLAVIVRDALRSMRQAQSDIEDPSTSAVRQIQPIVFAIAWCVAFFILVLLMGYVIATPIWVCVCSSGTKPHGLQRFSFRYCSGPWSNLPLNMALTPCFFKASFLGSICPGSGNEQRYDHRRFIFSARMVK